MVSGMTQGCVIHACSPPIPDHARSHARSARVPDLSFAPPSTSLLLFFLFFFFSSFLLLVASYDATLGQGTKAAPMAVAPYDATRLAAAEGPAKSSVPNPRASGLKAF